jgi:DNA-binding transcriptional LysR family regulator
MDLQLAAAVAGMGSTLLPHYLGEPHPQLARVSGPGEADAGVRLNAWLLSHPDSRGVARVQAVAELLMETLRTQNLQSEGEH